MAKKVMLKKGDEPKKPTAKKPIQLAEVRVTAARMKPKSDTVGVGYGDKTTRISANDLKGMVKKYKLKSIDTTSVQSMRRTGTGSRDMSDLADAYLAQKKKQASKKK